FLWREPMSHVTRPIVMGLLLTLMLVLTGCGGGGGEGNDLASADPPVASVSLAWQPVNDPSVVAYFVYYGRQSARQRGSSTYEGSMYVDSPSATVPNLETNTTYYFAVSAYNGFESPCSEEVSTVTSSI